jgi:hypothetical protein
MDPTRLAGFESESRQWQRKTSFVEDNTFCNNDIVNMVRYEYERFDPKKHLPLQVPVLE